MNTPTNPADRDLNARLAHEAEAFFHRGGTVLDIGQVLDRAGEIKRGRRMRATILMAACVLAIAVPTALVATNGTDADKRVTPAGPTKVDRSPLSLGGLDTGPAPAVGHLVDHTWHTPDGEVDLSGLDDPIREVAAYAGGLLAATQDDGGNLWANTVDDRGDITGQARPMEGGFAVSDGESLVGFAEPDGTPVVVQGDGQLHELPRIPRGTGFSAVAVAGEDCNMGEDGNGCAVWVRSSGAKPQVWVSTSDRVDPTLPQFDSLADVHGWELLAGITEVKDDLTTCSAVTGLDDATPLWTVCGDHPVAFSPDGEHLLAEPDGDGRGPVGLAVYDAADGTELLDLDVADDGYVRQMVWEDDTHVLATIYQGAQWAVVRIGLDGSREYAVAPVTATDDVDPPFMLPSH
jgi:hypothetical protein